MSYLIDTNILLEILLRQNNKEKCKNFLESNIGELFISDFSLHSIGVILFKYNKSEQFNIFIDDTLDKIEVITLPREKYNQIIDVYNQFKLDFDDAYQFLIAKENNLVIATMDNDYKVVDTEIDILFV